MRTSGPDIIIGPAGQKQGTYYTDVLTLVERGFLNKIPSEKDLHFIISERGFEFYEALKQPSRPVAAPPLPPPGNAQQRNWEAKGIEGSSPGLSIIRY